MPENVRFSIGDVASNTFAVIGRNFVPFAVLTFIAALPQVFLARQFAIAAVAPGGHVNPAAIFTASYWLTFTMTEFVSIVLSFILQAALTYSTFMDLSQKPISIVQALMVGLRAFFPLVAIGILFSLGVGFGFVLLLFPGLMLMTAWLVVIPAYIVERPGIIGAFGRSATLTRGHRWPIFGLMIVYSLAVAMIDFAARPLLGLPLLSSTLAFPIGYWVFSTVLRIITMVISSTGTAVIYYLLRASKEGVGPAALASIFE
jgi:hypothetical protein